jgi:peptide/nickel transport system permease protein
MSFVAVSVCVATVLGVMVGVTAGYFGGLVDAVLSLGTNILMAIPALIVLLGFLAVFSNSNWAAMIVLGVMYSPTIAKVVRAVTLAVREELYIDAAVVAGLSPLRIMRRHVGSRISGPICVQVFLGASQTLILVTALSYLGLISNPPKPSWGAMVAEAGTVYAQDSWMLVPCGLAIALTVLSLGLLGDAIRDASTGRWSGDPSTNHRRGRLHQPRGKATTTAERHAPAVNAVLSVRDMSVAFNGPSGERVVVSGVSFDVMRGEILGVVGESGSGKTASALGAIGLLPRNGRVVSGSRWFDGRELDRVSRAELTALRGKRIGFVAQDPMASLDPTFTVGSQLGELVRKHDGLSGGDTRARVVELLELVKIPGAAVVARRYPHELSGGMAQRVCIAMALAAGPDLLIADEPTTALDVTLQADILDLMRNLQREVALAILIITHNWGVIADICDRAVVMYAGEVVEMGSVDRLFAEPQHPYTWNLRQCDPASARRGDRLAGIPGTVPSPGAWPVGCRFADRCQFRRADCDAAAVPLVESEPAHLARCLHVPDLGWAVMSEKVQPEQEYERTT